VGWVVIIEEFADPTRPCLYFEFLSKGSFEDVRPCPPDLLQAFFTALTARGRLKKNSDSLLITQIFNQTLQLSYFWDLKAFEAARDSRKDGAKTSPVRHPEIFSLPYIFFERADLEMLVAMCRAFTILIVEECDESAIKRCSEELLPKSLMWLTLPKIANHIEVERFRLLSENTGQHPRLDFLYRYFFSHQGSRDREETKFRADLNNVTLSLILTDYFSVMAGKVATYKFLRSRISDGAITEVVQRGLAKRLLEIYPSLKSAKNIENVYFGSKGLDEHSIDLKRHLGLVRALQAQHRHDGSCQKFSVSDKKSSVGDQLRRTSSGLSVGVWMTSPAPPLRPSCLVS